MIHRIKPFLLQKVKQAIDSEKDRLAINKDKEIIERFAAGDENAAFQMLISNYQRPLYQLTRRMLGNHEDADDALQNTFIKAWKALPEFREESKLFSWLYRIASNECLNIIEKRKRHRSQTLDDMSEIMAPEQRGPSPEEIQTLLNQAMETLPAKQKLVFTLKYFQELKYEEISKITGTSVGALKSSYHISVKKIESILTDRSNL